MPGYVQYDYDADKLPAHTKPAFKKYTLQTAKNAILAQPKTIIIHSQRMLPISIIRVMCSSSRLEIYNTLCLQEFNYFQSSNAIC